MIEVKIDKKLRYVYGDRNTNVVWQWCVDNFGPAGRNGKIWGWDTDRIFWFHDQEDAMIFKLRWS